MYSSAYNPSVHQSHPLTRSDRWSDACGNVLGEAAAGVVTAVTRVVQLPFVAAAFILGEITDSFLRASDNVGDAVGREAGRFAGRLVGALASSALSLAETLVSMLYNTACNAFLGAINCARQLF